MASLPEFDIARKQLSQQNQVNQQAADDAIKRRLAAQGGLNSGAFVKAQERANEQIRREGQEASKGLAMAEIQERQRRDEVALDRDFQKDQMLFQREMAGKDLDFRNKVFGFEQNSKLKQLDLAERQFGLDKDAQEFNKQLALLEANKKTPGILDGLGLPGVDVKKLGLGAALAGPTGAIAAITPSVVKKVPVVSDVVKKFKF